MRCRIAICLLLGVAAAAYLFAVPERIPAQEADQAPNASAPDEGDRQQQREQSLKSMKDRAALVTVRTADGQTEAKLIATPLSRYLDEPRRINDATLWGWVADGRLLAVCKIEHTDREGYPLWSTCLVSTASRQIDAAWPGGRRWSARQPGIELQTLNTAPASAGGQTARLREMKELAARFKATIIRPHDNREEMRLLTRPVYRYEMPTGAIKDGAVFGLTSNGTNPDALLLLELHENADAAPEWRFGIAGVTAGGLSVVLEDKEVWSRPRVEGPGKFDTWYWFSERE